MPFDPREYEAEVQRQQAARRQAEEKVRQEAERREAKERVRIERARQEQAGREASATEQLKAQQEAAVMSAYARQFPKVQLEINKSLPAGQAMTATGVTRFVPQSNWTVYQTNAQGKTTAYLDRDNKVHYAPEHVMYKLGWREGGKLVTKDGAKFIDYGKGRKFDKSMIDEANKANVIFNKLVGKFYRDDLTKKEKEQFEDAKKKLSDIGLLSKQRGAGFGATEFIPGEFAGLTVSEYTLTKRQAKILNDLVRKKDFEGVFQYQKSLGMIDPSRMSPNEEKLLTSRMSAYMLRNGTGYDFALLVKDIAEGRTDLNYEDLAKYFGRTMGNKIKMAVNEYKAISPETTTTTKTVSSDLAVYQLSKRLGKAGLLNKSAITEDKESLTTKTLIDIFNELKKDGQIPEDAVFKGTTKNGEIEYEIPAVIKLEPSREIEVNGDEFARRVAQTMIDRPHLAQWQAEGIVRTEMRAEKKGIIEYRGDAAKDTKYILDHKDAEELKKAWKDAGIDAAGMIVPGVDTARNWGTMTTGEKALSIGLDVATLALLIFGPKIIGRVGKTLSGESKLVKTARVAGKAGNELRATTANYEAELVSKISPKSPTELAKLANRVEIARVNSVKADKTLLKYLEKIKEVSPGTLKKVENLSGLKDFKAVIENIGKATKKVDVAWKKVEKTKPLNTKAKLSAAETASNNKRLSALSNLEKAQSNLEKSLNDAGSVLKPRYSPKAPPPEFKGFSARFTKEKPKINRRDMDDLQRWLDETVARTRATSGQRTVIQRTKPMEVKPSYKMELRPEYKEPKPKAKTKTKTPAVSREKPAVFVRGKYKGSAKTSTIPSEAYGRMTAAQIERYYGTQQNFDVRAKTIEESLVDNKAFHNSSIREWQQVREAVQSAVAVLPATRTQSATKGQLETRIKDAVKDVVKESAESKTGPAPMTKPIVAPLNKTQVKVITQTATDVINKPTPETKITKPVKLPGGGDNKSKSREAIKDSLGAFTYRRGELQGKDVWHTWYVDQEGRLQRTILHGPAPVGAKVVTGKGSATLSLQKFRGNKVPNFNFVEDTGGSDTVISSNGKKLSISFVGNITGKGSGRISEGRPRISTGMGRISPKMPRLR